MAVSSFLAINRLSGINDRVNQIVDVAAEKVKLGARINQDALAVSRAEKNIILAKTQEEMDEYAAFTAQTRQEMQDRRAVLRELVDEEGQAKLDEFAAVWDEYLAVNDEVRDLSRLNSNQRAEQLSQNEAREAFDLAAADVTAIVDKNDEEADEAQELVVLKRVAEEMKLGARIKADLIEIQRGEKNMILSNTQAEMDEYAEGIAGNKQQYSRDSMPWSSWSRVKAGKRWQSSKGTTRLILIDRKFYNSKCKKPRRPEEFSRKMKQFSWKSNQSYV